jgi:lipoic acid synthetase
MILGNICTRACKFCAVQTGNPRGVTDPDEPERLAESIAKMHLKHCVITSVDRDDLPDLGAGFWATAIRQIRQRNPGVTVEALIPDFNGEATLIGKVTDAAPEIISHNLETVRRLTPEVRSRARYDISLKTIETVAGSGRAKPKSGIMVGLGETEEEVLQTMDDLIDAGCRILTIGQYLQPTRKHLAVKEYVSPGQFRKYAAAALEKGFAFVESAPLVRSSYRAERHVERTGVNDEGKRDF